MTTEPSPPRWPCPCCGYLVYSEPPGNYEICPVCGWEDDLAQLRFACQGGGANRSSLLEAQLAFCRRERDGAPVSGQRDPGWRRLDPAVDRIEISQPGHSYGRSYADDATAYYYWREPDPMGWGLDAPQACVELYLELWDAPRPLSEHEAQLMVDLVNAWRHAEGRKHRALMTALTEAGLDPAHWLSDRARSALDDVDG